MPGVLTRPSTLHAPRDDGRQVALDAAPAFRKPAGEVAAAAQLGRRQGDRAGVRAEGPFAVAVATVHTRARTHTETGAERRVRLGAPGSLGEALHHFPVQVRLGPLRSLRTQTGRLTLLSATVSFSIFWVVATLDDGAVAASSQGDHSCSVRGPGAQTLTSSVR